MSHWQTFGQSGQFDITASCEGAMVSATLGSRFYCNQAGNLCNVFAKQLVLVETQQETLNILEVSSNRMLFLWCIVLPCTPGGESLLQLVPNVLVQSQV